MVAKVELEKAVDSLVRAESEALQEYERIRRLRENTEQLIGVTRSAAQAGPITPYTNLGIVAAVEKFFVEQQKKKGTPGKVSFTTAEITKGLIERGWRTRSRNPTPTVYSTMANAKKKFKRTKDGESWELITTNE